MEIVHKQNKYFLQFDSGELELSEQQVQKRLERGDKVLEKLQKLQDVLPDVKGNVEVKKSSKLDMDDTLSSQFTSAKYFEFIFTEFKEIYKANRDNPETVNKLVRFCKNSIHKLEDDRKSPRTDHVVIDFYILSWHRVIAYLQTLPVVVAEEEKEQQQSVDTLMASTQSENVNIQYSETSQAQQPKDYTKQLLIIQLMQADGLFPINNALEGIKQDDIQKLIAGILGVEENVVRQALHNASSILLKRDVTHKNIVERIQLLEEVETYFEVLPYSDIISRIKLLLKLYREKL